MGQQSAGPAPGVAAGKAPRTPRGERTMRKILDAALAEFGERGFSESSIVSITTRAKVALGLFLLAALGGLAMFVLYMKGRRPPIPLAIGHAAAAVAALVTLLSVVLFPS